MRASGAASRPGEPGRSDALKVGAKASWASVRFIAEAARGRKFEKSWNAERGVGVEATASGAGLKPQIGQSALYDRRSVRAPFHENRSPERGPGFSQAIRISRQQDLKGDGAKTLKSRRSSDRPKSRRRPS